jgi:hypothetical protein
MKKYVIRISVIVAVLVALAVILTACVAYPVGMMGRGRFAGPDNGNVPDRANGQRPVDISAFAVAKVAEGAQTVDVQVGPSSYQPVIVQKGIPVKMVLKVAAQDLNACNGRVIIPAFGIDQQLQAGENVISFTPDQAGSFPYTCWMSMIRSTILVVDDINNIPSDLSSIPQAPGSVQPGRGYGPGGCCGRNAPYDQD